MNITEELNEALIKATKLCSEYKLLFNNYYTINNILEDYITELLLIDPDIYDKIIEIPIVKFIEKHLGKGSFLHYRIIFSIMLFSLFISEYYLNTKLKLVKTELDQLKESLYDPDELADIAYDTYFELKEEEISDIPHFIENFNLKLHEIFNEITNKIYLLFTIIRIKKRYDLKYNIDAEKYFEHMFGILEFLFYYSKPSNMEIVKKYDTNIAFEKYSIEYIRYSILR